MTLKQVKQPNALNNTLYDVYVIGEKEPLATPLDFAGRMTISTLQHFTRCHTIAINRVIRETSGPGWSYGCALHGMKGFEDKVVVVFRATEQLGPTGIPNAYTSGRSNITAEPARSA